MRVFELRLALLTSAMAAMAVPSQAVANDSSANAEVSSVRAGSRQFTPDFFTTYAPVTALDMVKRIPGFSISEGEGRRGFGENAGNVLIDGDRPSTKSDDVWTMLSRIPASQVEYIELS